MEEWVGSHSKESRLDGESILFDLRTRWMGYKGDLHATLCGELGRIWKRENHL